MQKEDMPLVSIIIPCYNHEQYVVKTLSSVIADTYQAKEIVIIDDGSKDDSSHVIKNWIDANKSEISIIFKTRPNKGLTATLNELIDLANGKYLLILASDDLLINNTIQDRVAILEENNSKMVVISDAEVIDMDDKLIYDSMMEGFHKGNKKNYQSFEGIINEIVFNFTISGAVLMVNKEIYNLIGKYPEDLKAEDLYFYIKSACLDKILFWDKKVSQYRIHETNTSIGNPKLLRTVIHTYYKTFRFLPSWSMKIRLVKRIILYYYLIIAIKIKSIKR